MQSSEWFLLYSFSKIFLAFVILCRNKMFCNNKRNIPHLSETNHPSSEGGNICASITRWTPWWWRLSDGCGEVTDSHVCSLRWVLGVLIADVSKNEPKIPEFTIVTLWDRQISCIKLYCYSDVTELHKKWLCQWQYSCFRDFRLPPRCRSDLRFSRLLHSVEC